MKKVPITVLMSVYNGVRWLEEAIMSILHQSFGEFEFIIVNDGSTDGSLEVIKKVASLDKRIVLIDKKNTGLADSLNYGIYSACGEWIARIDADDLSAPDRLKKQYDLMKSDSSLVLIGTGLQIIDEYGNLGKLYRYPMNHDKLLSNLISNRKYFAHSSSYYHTETVRKLGGYRVRIKRGQDWDLWLRLSECGCMACIDEPLVKIRRHSLQISNDEMGKRQRTDSMIAIISYLLKKDGYMDPVSLGNDDYNVFYDWIVQKMNELGEYKYLIYVRNVKEKIANGLISKRFGLLLIDLVFSEPVYLIRYMHEKIYGDILPNKIAKLWINSYTLIE